MPSDAQRQAAADVVAKARSKTTRVRLVLDGDLLDEQAQHPDDEDIKARVAAAEVEFVFKGMGRTRWRKLKADHPPTDPANGLDVNPDTFYVAAIAASLVSPEVVDIDGDEVKLDEAGMARLCGEVLDEQDYLQLWSACNAANVGGAPVSPEQLAALAMLVNGRPR